MANIYRAYNGVSNDVYKYDFLFVVKKQKGAINYDLFELKLDFPSELESFMKDVSKFGVVSVTKKQCRTSLQRLQVCHPVICHSLLYGHAPYP
jgi:hypothetical protein